MDILIWIPRIVGGVALLYLAGVLAAAAFGYIFLIKSGRKNARFALVVGSLGPQELPARLFGLPWETEKVFSPRRNSSLAVWALPGAGGGMAGAGTIILLHGILGDHAEMIKYAQGFIERGWNVVSFDFGGHGGSPEGSLPTPSFGYYEKYDLDAVVDWTAARFPGARPLIVAGESMGAATALQYLPLAGDRKIDGVIADCPFTSAAEEAIIIYRLSHIPACIAHPALALGNILIRIFRGYSIYTVSPLKDVLSSPTPVLFIHGGDDHFVPTRMSVRMAEARQQAGLTATALVIIPGAAHTESVRVDRERWFREAFAFIDTCGKQINTEGGSRT
jgi:alpha-beta hydrolase superfamily lysophospholipase